MVRRAAALRERGFVCIALDLTAVGQNPSEGRRHGGQPERAPDWMGAHPYLAKRLCANCPVRADCLEAALARHETYGIWGGLNELERRALLKT